jgi:hypothetical protein
MEVRVLPLRHVTRHSEGYLGFTALLFLGFAIIWVPYAVRSFLGLPEGQLVSGGVQSITICDKHHCHVWAYIPDVGVGFWEPVQKGDCRVWYHVTAEE